MAIPLEMGNLFQLISFISPFMLAFFLIVGSLFNQDVRGLIYLAGVLIATLVNSILMSIIGDERTSDAQPLFCSIFNLTDAQIKYTTPSPTTLFIAFTATYLILPMKANNNINYAVIVFLMGLLGIDWVTKVQSKCTTNSGALLGILTGWLLGTVWYTIIYQSGYKTLLYFDALNSNKVYCNRPSKQTFKCSVYKNGELVSHNTM